MKNFKQIFLVIAFFTLASNISWSQPWTYNFGTGTGIFSTSNSASTTFLPQPTTGAGEDRVRVSNGQGGSFNLENPGLTSLGTGSELRIVAPTGGSVNKFSVYDYTAGKSFYTKFSLLLGNNSGANSVSSGTFYFFQGDGASYSDNNAFSGTQVFTGLRFVYGASGSVTTNYRNGSGWSALGSTPISQGNVYTVEIYGNNTTATINYTYNSTPQTVAANKQDIWINGVLIGDDIAKAQLANDANIDSWMFYGESSTGNAANIFLDDISYNNTISSTIVEPTTQTTNITFSSVTSSSFTVNWTNGNGGNRAVFMKEGSGAITNPADGSTYTASADWSSKGTQLGTSGYYCVYNGSSNTVNISNLSPNTTYYVQSFEYNGSGATSDYLTSTATGNPNNQTTSSAPIAPTSLAVTSINGSSQVTVSPGTFSVTVQSQDDDGNPANVTSNTTVTLSKNSGATGTLGGTLTGTITSGNNSVTITGVTYSVAETSVSVTASATGLTSGNSSNFIVFFTQPSNQPTSLSFSNLSTTGYTVSYTAATGSPSGYIVIRKAGSAPTTDPVDGVNYSAGSILGDGIVAYEGSLLNFAETGLTPGTQYFYKVYSYNGPSTYTTRNFLQTSPLTGSRYALSAEPTVQSSNVTFTNVQGTSMTINWTNGDGSNRIVLMKKDFQVNGNPSDGSTYTANSVFGSGSSIPTTNYVVYKGTGTSVDVTGLDYSTTYYVAVYEFNGSSTSENYLTTTPATGNQATGAPVEITYYSVGSGTLADAIWSTTPNGTGQTITSNSATNLIIQNGHTVLLPTSWTPIKNLTVESGGKLWSNNATNRYLDVYGDIICDGIIGNGSTFDGISFNIEGTSCEISGSGTMDVSRIRKDKTTNSTTNLTINKDLNIRWSATGLYNGIVGTNFNITIGSGYSVNVLNNVCVDGIDGSDASVLEYGGSLTVNGNLSVNGTFYATTDNIVRPTSLIIGSTGTVATNAIDFSNSGTAGHTLQILNGGKLSITGNHATVPGTTNNTYDFQSASTVEFSYSGTQNIYSFGSSYSNLSITGTGNKTLFANTTIGGNLSLTSGLLFLGDKTLTVDGSINITSPSASNMIVLDDGTNSGLLKKKISANNIPYNFYIGDTRSTTEFTPATIEFSGSSFTNAYLNIQMKNDKEPQNLSSTNFINRYWTIEQEGISNINYSIELNYTDADIVGTDLDMYFGKLNGSTYTSLGIANYAQNKLQKSGVTSFSTFTGGTETAMPVTLASFNSSVKVREIKLSWTTAEELNNSGFYIERKSLNSDWQKIVFVNGNNKPSSYEYTDRNLTTGKYQYRLKQIDYNGNFEYHTLDGIVEVGVPAKFDLSQNYPNPFNPITKINFDLPKAGQVSLKVFDILGKEVKTLVNEFKDAGYYNITFDASGLPSGVYFYRISAGEFSNVKKLVLLK